MIDEAILAQGVAPSGCHNCSCIAISAISFTRMGHTGPDQAMLYLLAAWTGFRKGELVSLTLRHFKLDADPPVVSIRAAYSKRRREDMQVLHPDIVDEFKKWLKIRRPKNDHETKLLQN